jgi:hypothetical protein
MLCVYIEVVRVANDLLNCLEVEVGVTVVGASAPSAHYTHNSQNADAQMHKILSCLHHMTKIECFTKRMRGW